MILKVKNGSGIHIKKKNRGKFTEYCGGKVTNSCIAKAKASGNPTLVKRATFAANARKWKHQMGGILIPDLGVRINQNPAIQSNFGLQQRNRDYLEEQRQNELQQQLLKQQREGQIVNSILGSAQNILQTIASNAINKNGVPSSINTSSSTPSLI